jgi:hypothetical protein
VGLYLNIADGNNSLHLPLGLLYIVLIAGMNPNQPLFKGYVLLLPQLLLDLLSTDQTQTFEVVAAVFVHQLSADLYLWSDRYLRRQTIQLI